MLEFGGEEKAHSTRGERGLDGVIILPKLVLYLFMTH